MNVKNYNVMTLSINEALERKPFGTGGGYIKLLQVPTGANVLIHLNESNADGIPLKAYHEIEATHIDKVFISCNAILGETLKIVQAKTSKDFKMITPASDVNVDTINKVGDRFRPSGVATQNTITAGSSHTFTKVNQTAIRFHSTDEIGIELNTNGIKYPMFEEELHIDNIDTVKFYNDTAGDIVLTVLEM